MQSAKIAGSSFLTSWCAPTKITKGFAPSIDHDVFTTGNKDGVALGTPYYKNISLIIEILVKGSTLSEVATNRDNLIKLFRLPTNRSLKTKELIIVTDAGKTKKLDVVTTSITSSDEAERKGYCYVTIGLQGKTPYWKGDNKEKTIYISSGGGFSLPFGVPVDLSVGTGAQSVEFVNSGNTEMKPTIRVYGDMSSFGLVNDTLGLTLSCSESLGVGDYIDLDFENETAVKNGITNVLSSISGDWWSLQPGSNQLRISTVSTSQVAHADVTYFDAYMGL